MIFKKDLSFASIGITLISIIIVGLLHFIFTGIYTNKIENTSNTIRLLNQTKVQVGKINTISDLLENYTLNIHNDMISTADVVDYSISVLINGGLYSNFEQPINFSSPNSQELQKLKKYRRTWNEYHNLLLQVSNNNYGELPLVNIKSKYKTLLTKQDSVFKLYYNKYEALKTSLFLINLLSGIFYLIISILIYLLIKNVFLKPIEFVESSINNISKGKLIEKNSKHGYYNKVISNLNNLQNKILDRYNFVNQLVNDNYSVKFKEYDKNDFLESALVELRNKLSENIKQNTIRQEEEKLRQWFTDGQAKFNDILRESSESINFLAEMSLKNIVKFLDAAQGGFFIIKEEEEERHLELISSFAYDRVKALTKKIPIDEGLIGMCAIEKNTIWLSNVPDGYMDIESGLGDAPPKNVLIVPLKTDENILGVIELASFNEFNKDEVLFIENIADDIASTLETTKITDKTSFLLEESQKQSVELAMRDSEMSEKIEELRDLQKQTSKSETEMTSLILAVDKILFKLEISQTGRVFYANKLLLNKLNLKSTEIEKTTILDIVSSDEISLIKELIKKAFKNETIQQTIHYKTKDGLLLKTNSTFSPIKDETGIVYKVLILSDDISNVENLEQNNKLLSTEIEEQQLFLLNINTEKENNIKESKLKVENAKIKLSKYYKIEKRIKDKFETSTDKKYNDWINSFNN